MEAIVGWRNYWDSTKRPWRADPATWSGIEFWPSKFGGPGPAGQRWKKTPELLKVLAGLLRDNAAGDPMGRRGVWTDKRLTQIAQELRRWDIHVRASTVRRLLRQLGYGLHANLKSLSKPHPDRSRQFQCIDRQRRRFARQALPIISIDTKKKELIGNFKNPGRVWSLRPTPVMDHDFRSDASHIAIPYGIYDVTRNRGSVFVGISHDTPAFAAHNVARWWRDYGRKHYPHADELLILADSGGSNGAPVRAWKWELQRQLVVPFGLTVTVCHYPTGASKWNPFEHRLFGPVHLEVVGDFAQRPCPSGARGRDVNTEIAWSEAAAGILPRSRLASAPVALAVIRVLSCRLCHHRNLVVQQFNQQLRDARSSVRLANTGPVNL